MISKSSLFLFVLQLQQISKPFQATHNAHATSEEEALKLLESLQASNVQGAAATAVEGTTTAKAATIARGSSLEDSGEASGGPEITKNPSSGDLESLDNSVNEKIHKLTTEPPPRPVPRRPIPRPRSTAMPDSTPIAVNVSAQESINEDGISGAVPRLPPPVPRSRPARPATATSLPTVEVQSVANDSSPVLEVGPPVPAARPTRPPRVQSPEESGSSESSTTTTPSEEKIKPVRRAPPIPKGRNASAINDQNVTSPLDDSFTGSAPALPAPLLPSRPPRPASEAIAPSEAEVDRYAVFRDIDINETTEVPSAPPPVPRSRPQRPVDSPCNNNNSAAESPANAFQPTNAWPAEGNTAQAVTPTNPFEATDDWATQATVWGVQKPAPSPSNPFANTDDWATQASSAAVRPPPPVPSRPRPAPKSN